MSEHLRASVADIDARLDALQMEMQRLADAKGVLLKLMGVLAPAPTAAEAVTAFGRAFEAAARTEEPPPAPPPPRPVARAQKPEFPSSSNTPGVHDATILKALAGGPVALIVIARAMGLNPEASRYHVKRLVQAKRVIELPPVDGSNARRFGLAGNHGRAAAQPPAADPEEDARRSGFQRGGK